MKLITVMEESTLWERVAVTVTPVSGEVANARQISEVPNCPFVRSARAQVRPAPETAVTVMFEDEASVDINASSNSFGAAVENVELADRVLALVMSWELTTSIVIPARAETVIASRAKLTAKPDNTIRFAYIPMIRAIDSYSFGKQYTTTLGIYSCTALKRNPKQTPQKGNQR